MGDLRDIAERYLLGEALSRREGRSVHRAVDTASGSTVIVKRIATGGAAASAEARVQEFRRDMALLAELRHPQLPVLLDFGRLSQGAQGEVFAVFEPLRGSAADALTGGAPDEVLRFVLQAIDGLEALSRKGLRHLHLRPDNLWVAAGPSREELKLLGWGSRYFLSPGEDDPYAAPEVAVGAAADARADLYSLAQIVCPLLGLTLEAAPGGARVQIPLVVRFELEDADTLQEILERCLRTAPAERGVTFNEVRRALIQALGRAELSATSVDSPVAPAAPEPEPEDDPGDDTNPVFAQHLEGWLGGNEPAPNPTPTPPGAAPSGASEVTAVFLPPLPPPPPAPPPAKPAPAAAKGRRPAWLVPALALLLPAAAGIGWWLSRSPRTPPAPSAAVAAPAAPAALAPAAPPEPAPVLGSESLGTEALGTEVLGTEPIGDPAELAKALSQQLRQATAAGNPARMAGLLRSLRPVEKAVTAADPSLRREIAAARKAVDQWARLEKAVKGGEPAEVVALAAAVQQLLPRYAAAGPQRERAAAALEGDADALLQRGDPAAALSRLEALRGAWPDRPGLADRISRVETEKRALDAVQNLLAAVAAAEGRRKPDEGLNLLRSAKIAPRYQDRLRDAEQRLERQLDQLDRTAPTVEFVGAGEQFYEKGQEARLEFRVGDDYRVQDVVVRVRAEGERGATEVTPQRSGSTYTASIPAGLHRNRPLAVEVTASDLSGHKTSAQRQIRRRTLLERLRGKE